jgi:hypothetical protein
MQSIQIDGTFTYIDTVKTVKLGDPVKLIKNPNNRINKEAIGVYTMDGKKLGYVPFKSSQLDITESFYISKINLTKDNLQLLISRKYMAAGDSNIIQSVPSFTLLKNVPEIFRKSLVSTFFPENFIQDLKRFQKNLEKSGVKFNRIVPIYYDTNYITILIETLDDNDEKTKNYFYLVTKEYYDKNVFKYDEFFELGLMARNIYIPFQTHRLETYIEKNYKPIKVNRRAKTDTNITETKIERIFKTKTIDDEDIIRAIIQSEIMGTTISEDYSINLLPLLELFPNVKVGGICYNTTLKKYCYIDMYCDDMIIELIFEKPTKTGFATKINEMNCKLEIANKSTFVMINPIDGILYKINNEY